MKYFSFFEHRRVFFAFSALLILVGLVFLFINGVSLDIQFTGGAILKYDYQGEVDANRVAEKASEWLGRTVSAQVTSDLSTGQNRMVLNLAGAFGMSAGEQAAFEDAMNEAFPEAAFVPAESSLVEPFFGKRFLRRSILALCLALVLILVYEWITFRKIGGLAAGLTALAALFHDLLMVFFTCVIARIPIGDTFVAVALSIIGYSINDTIVIFDRIRENRRTYPKLPVETVADLSIRQSMMRSINTNVAVTVAVAAIYLLAGRASLDSVVAFALPMTVGSISGCYSTLCLAGPLWILWQERIGRKAPATQGGVS